MSENFEFLHPVFLWLFGLLPILVFWFFWQAKKSTASLKIANTKAFSNSKNYLGNLRTLLPVLRLLAISALIIALARPRSFSVSTKTKTNRGIDIVMALDVSVSMLAKDLKPNRLEALKKVAEDFINMRPNDRIGLVVYEAESYTKTPVTSDKSIAIRSLRELKSGDLKGGTAIGMGLGSAINRIKDSKAKSKVIILLTDGVNNSGFIDPITVTEVAKEMHVKVYTIGIGTNGSAMSPIGRSANGRWIYGYQKVEIDEKLLQTIAKETGGMYFRATSNTQLKKIYDEINKMEKTEIEEFKFYNYDEQFRFWVFLAGALLLIELFFRFTVFRSFV